MKEKKEENIEIPFATYDIDGKKEKSKVQEHPKKHADVFDSKKEKGEIVIRLKPIKLDARTVERAVFVGIILFLASLLIFKPAFIFFDNPLDTNVSGAVTKSDETNTAAAASETTEDSEQLSPTTATTTVVTEPEEEEEEEVVDTTPKLTGKIKLIIGTIDTVKKEVGGKITSVGFVVDNQKSAFVPEVKIYIYDADSRDIYKTKPRETFTAEDVLGAGKKLARVVPLLAQFPSITGGKSVKLELYDAETDELIVDGIRVVVIE
ncbi:MAG: hypothetical protein QF362_01135 [Candidatus Woesearchaeota archaeon]|jgi:hypothetical protein|nr:hypothetical protein [Candidatus Woesearchaeota archaeon]MDP7506033.1 hypothetical protein [Candidatus Woesearchaeota archaeon]|tara:strand:- start:1499 stop:2290 length:792 start_codon:yes stop_codon:yes gene_type:complete